MFMKTFFAMLDLKIYKNDIDLELSPYIKMDLKINGYLKWGLVWT